LVQRSNSPVTVPPHTLLMYVQPNLLYCNSQPPADWRFISSLVYQECAGQISDQTGVQEADHEVTTTSCSGCWTSASPRQLAMTLLH